MPKVPVVPEVLAPKVPEVQKVLEARPAVAAA